MIDEYHYKGSLQDNKKRKLLQFFTLNPRRATNFVLTLTLMLVLPVTIFFALNRTGFQSKAALEGDYDVVVAGAGTGGVSAAIQAAKLGMRVALLEETDWLGGQMTAAAVSNMDEGYGDRNGIYLDFTNRIRKYYEARGKSVSTCYWGGDSICFEPSVGRIILQQMIDEVRGQGKTIDVKFRHRIIDVSKSGNTINGVFFEKQDKSIGLLGSKVLIDATEYGDIIPLTGARYRVGKTFNDNKDLNACIQDITHSAVMKKYPGGVPSDVAVPASPPQHLSLPYATSKAQFVQFVSNEATTSWGALPLNSATHIPNSPYPFQLHNGYRGMPDSTGGNYTAANQSEGANISKTGINFANDFPATVRFLEDREYRRQEICKAKLKTLQFVYYVHRDLGQSQWSLANDEGFQNSSFAQDNICAGIIPAEYQQLEKHLAVVPYVRESRRIVGMGGLTVSLADLDIKGAGNGYKFARQFTDSVSVGAYPPDLHLCKTDNDIESEDIPYAAQNIQNRAFPEGRVFSIPFRAFVPESVDGFVAAEKNISQTRVVNGSTRLQPITMKTGMTAGTIAALSIQQRIRPREVNPVSVQKVVIDGQTPTSVLFFGDVPMSHPFWSGVQLASTWEIMRGDLLNFSTEGVLTRGEMAAVLRRTFNLDTSGATQVFTDVPVGAPFFEDIYALSKAGITQGSIINGQKVYEPNNPTIRKHLAIFIHRGPGFVNRPPTISNPFTDVPDDVFKPAILLMKELGIMNGCGSTIFCPDQSVTRAQTAQVIRNVKIFQNPNPSGTISFTSPTDRQFTPTPGQVAPTPTSTPPLATPVPQNPEAYFVGEGTYNIDPNTQKIKGSFDGLTRDGKLYGWVCDSDNYAAAVNVHIYVNGPFNTPGAGMVAAGAANVAGEAGIGGFCGGTTAHRFFIDLPQQFRDGVRRKFYVHGININPGPNNLLPFSNGREIAFQVATQVSVPTPTPTSIPTPTPTSTAGTMIQIFAEGTPAGGVYPTMDLYIRGQIVRRYENITSGVKASSYTYLGSATRSDIRVYFSNDAVINGQDRNLKVDKIQINGQAYETETATTYSTGTWSSSNGCGPGNKQSEWLHCQGYFQY